MSLAWVPPPGAPRGLCHSQANSGGWSSCPSRAVIRPSSPRPHYAVHGPARCPQEGCGPQEMGVLPQLSHHVHGARVCAVPSECVFLSPCRGHALAHFAQRHPLCAFAGAAVNQAPQTGSHCRHVRSPGPRGRSPRCRRGQGGSSRGLSPHVWTAVASRVVPPCVSVS